MFLYTQDMMQDQYDYIFVKNSDKDGKQNGCLNGCIYKKKDDSNSENYFCFKKGSLPVKCTKDEKDDDDYESNELVQVIEL